jgi:hypothetical protein
VITYPVFSAIGRRFPLLDGWAAEAAAHLG